MTAPIGHGYPDYGRFQARSDILLHNEIGTSIDASVIRGRFFTGHVPAYGLRVTSTTNHFEVTARFFDSQTGGNEFAAHTYSVRQGGGIDIASPALGPWMQLEVEPSAAASVFSMRSWTTHALGRAFRNDPTDPILLSAVDPAVGAGATVNYDAARVWPGEVHWHVSTALATWAAQIGVFDWAGVFTVIDQFDQTGGGKQSRRVFVPPVNVRVALTNLTGAPGAMRYVVAARSMGPGW